MLSIRHLIYVGPIWVLIIYDERYHDAGAISLPVVLCKCDTVARRPPLFTVIGGAFLMLSVAGHEYAALRAQNNSLRKRDLHSSANVVTTTNTHVSDVELSKKGIMLSGSDDYDFEE